MFIHLFKWPTNIQLCICGFHIYGFDQNWEYSEKRILESSPKQNWFPVSWQIFTGVYIVWGIISSLEMILVSETMCIGYM